MKLTYIGEDISTKEIQQATRIPRVRIEQLVRRKKKGDWITFKHLKIKIKEL